MWASSPSSVTSGKGLHVQVEYPLSQMLIRFWILECLHRHYGLTIPTLENSKFQNALNLKLFLFFSPHLSFPLLTSPFLSSSPPLPFPPLPSSSLSFSL
jgi:hypothetical protein